MRFRTEVSPVSLPFKLDLKDKIFLIGSCFSENVGEKFRNFKFKTLINPYGTLFNPLAISQAIQEILNQKKYAKADLINEGEFWHSLNHSSFSNADSERCLIDINQSIEEAHSFLKETKYVIITLGSAWAYQFSASGKWVANCHKIPSNKFKKELLDVNTITEALNSMVLELLSFNPSVKIIYTISPVRHWKDGFEENLWSKSALILAAKKWKDSFPEQVFYFPSYEMVMDDLRDYRFYKDDLLHPNQMAIDYIWEKLIEVAFSSETKDLLNRIDKINKMLAHKPFNKNSESYSKFSETIFLQMAMLEKELNETIFEKDRQFLRQHE